MDPYYPHDVELKKKGVIYLRPEHAAAVFYLNGQGFQDSPYLETDSAIINTLVGQELANCIKGRPTLSMGLLRQTSSSDDSQSSASLSAYILAHETTITPQFSEWLGRDINIGNVGEKIVYLDEWVARNNARGLASDAMPLLTEWLRVIEERYPKQGETIKIVTLAREKTSLPIIEKILDKRGLDQALVKVAPLFGEGQEAANDNAQVLVITIRPEDVRGRPPFFDLASQ